MWQPLTKTIQDSSQSSPHTHRINCDGRKIEFIPSRQDRLAGSLYRDSTSCKRYVQLDFQQMLKVKR